MLNARFRHQNSFFPPQGVVPRSHYLVPGPYRSSLSLHLCVHGETQTRNRLIHAICLVWHFRIRQSIVNDRDRDLTFYAGHIGQGSGPLPLICDRARNQTSSVIAWCRRVFFDRYLILMRSFFVVARHRECARYWSA